MLGVSISLLDAELFLPLFFPSNKVVVVLVLGGVDRPSIRATSLTTTCEANACLSSASSLLTMPFSNFEDSRVMGLGVGVDSKDDLPLGGHILFICPLGVPLWIFRCEQK